MYWRIKRDKSDLYDPDLPNTIITSYNRNFAKRNDDNPLALYHLHQR